MDETLTLLPPAIVDGHPQEYGVSPGHCGVPGPRTTLMSRRRPFGSGDKLFRGFDDFFHGEPKLLVDRLVGSRSAEAIDAKNDPVVADPALPGHRMRGLH